MLYDYYKYFLNYLIFLYEGTDQEAIRNKWIIDEEIPIFTQDKDYVNKLIFV